MMFATICVYRAANSKYDEYGAGIYGATLVNIDFDGDRPYTQFSNEAV
jgi:hypothetical protein